MFKKYIFILAFIPLSVFADGNTDRLKYYLNEANVALANKDYSFACELMREALSYATVAEGGKYLAGVQKNTQTTCGMAEKSAIKGYNQAIQNHPYYPYCPSFRKAKQDCSVSGNYSNCMRIRFGSEYKRVEDSSICN